MNREQGKGPFTVGKPTQMPNNGTDYDVVEIFDVTGSIFAVVFADDCVGQTVVAAKARATRITEALNRA